MNYAKRDAELEARSSVATEELAEHRWHWTLDESNPERVTVKQYAKDVARAQSTIQCQARGYADWDKSNRSRPISEHIQLANMGAERAAATEAVAGATGKSVSTLKAGQNRELVSDVLDVARHRAEANGTTVEEEVTVAAERQQQAAKARKKTDAGRKERHSMRYLEVEGKVARAKRLLSEALITMEGVEFDGEEKDLISDSVANLIALLKLIDLRAIGATEVDWDQELTKLTS